MGILEERKVNQTLQPIERNSIWNEPFPNDLITVNGNKARFKKSKNKTHTSFNGRKVSLKVEIEKASGAVELHDIGSYLINQIGIEQDVTIKLDDMAKPLMNSDAEKVKSGYQFYRNIPAKTVVEELVKSVYPDSRNLECPREFIIDSIQNHSVDGIPQIFGLGRPPVFGKITDDNVNSKTCEAIIETNFNGISEIYLGIGNSLYRLSNETGLYTLIHDFDQKFKIRKMWYNSSTSNLVGIATEEEELVSINDELPNWQNKEVQVGLDFLIFSYDNAKVSIDFDSTKGSDAKTFPHKLVTGKYHYVQPYFVGKRVNYGEYRQTQSSSSYRWVDPSKTRPEYSNYYMILSGLGNFSKSVDLLKIIKNGITYRYPLTESIRIPFSQKIGFIFNKTDNMFLISNHSGIVKTGNGFGWYPSYQNCLNDKYSSRINVHIFPQYVSARNQNSYSVEKTIHIFDSIKEFEGFLDLIPYSNNGPQLPPFDQNEKETINWNPGEISFANEEITVEGGQVDMWNPLRGEKVYDPSSGSFVEKFNWLKAPWPWIKYTSGQDGNLTYIPNQSTKGTFFLSFLDKGTDDRSRKYIQQKDIKTDAVNSSDYEGGDAAPYKFALKHYFFDLTTKAWTQLPSLSDYKGNDVMRDYFDTEWVSSQITCTAVNANEVYIATMGFNNITQAAGNNTKIDLQKLNYHRTKLFRISVSDLNHITLTEIWDNVRGLKNLTITSMSHKDSTLWISSYDRDKIVSYGQGNITPVPDQCFYLSKNNPETFIQGPLLQQVVKTRGSRDASLHYLYWGLVSNRNGKGQELKLYQMNTTGDTHVSTILGSINDTVAGESNIFSNLLPVKEASGNESVYGITSAYYPNPVMSISSKNHLFKYGINSTAVVELADFTGLKVWDALTQLAKAYNYLMGFDNDVFYFVQKNVSAEPDIIINADLLLDSEISKTLEMTVSNIVTVIPFFAKKGEINWEITLCANERTDGFPDEGREKMDAALRIIQGDDLSKSIIMRVGEKGSIPNIDNPTTSLRFDFLIHNSVIETTLYREILSGEDEVYLPSFFSDSNENQIAIGDVIAIDIEDEDGSFSQVVRIVKSLNFDTNSIKVDKIYDQNFKIGTVVHIFRSFVTLNEESKAKIGYNSWSSGGVTWVPADFYKNYSDDHKSLTLQVASINNLGVNNIISFGEHSIEYKITKKLRDIVTGRELIDIERLDGQVPDLNFITANSVVRCWWTPLVPKENEDSLVEVGGSNVFVGFELGSSGIFWKNRTGEDRVTIECPGLVLESDQNSRITKAELDSIESFGKKELKVEDNKFVNRGNARSVLNEAVAWNAYPKILLELKNIAIGANTDGIEYHIPAIRVLNTSEKRLFIVRVISEKLFRRFPGYSCDFYITAHSIDTRNFTQNLSLRSKVPY